MTQRIKWECLKDLEKKITFRNKINEILEERQDRVQNNDSTQWDEISEVVMKAAKEVCGLKKKRIENPWMVDKDEEVGVMRHRITTAIGRRNELRMAISNNIDIQQNTINLEQTITELKNARKELKKSS